MDVVVRRKTDAFTHFLKCLLNLSPREQPLLLALDMFSVKLVEQRPSQGAAAEMLPKMTRDATYSS